MVIDIIVLYSFYINNIRIFYKCKFKLSKCYNFLNNFNIFTYIYIYKLNKFEYL